MAKKKAKSKKGGKKKSSSKMGINTSKLMGMAGGVYIKEKLLPQLTFYANAEPKTQAIISMIAGEFAPKQDFVKGMMKDTDVLNGAGDAMTVLGMKDLMSSMGISGIGALSDNDELAVAIEGIDDIDNISDDRRSRKRRSDDIDVIDEDVLGDDDMGSDISTIDEDVLGDDDDMGDDLDAFNDDDLGDDD